MVNFHNWAQENFWTYVALSYLGHFWPCKVKIGIKMCRSKVRFFWNASVPNSYRLLFMVQYIIKNLRQSLVLNHFYLFLTMWLLPGRRQWLHWEWHGGAQWCGPVRQVLTWSCRQRFQATDPVQWAQLEDSQKCIQNQLKLSMTVGVHWLIHTSANA